MTSGGDMTEPQLPNPKTGVSGWLGRPVWGEARAPIELRKLRRSPLWQGHGIPPGEGRPVLLIPGFMSGTHKAESLAHVLKAAGYLVKIAEVGRNAGPAYRSLDAAAENLAELAEQSSQQVAIVGHSRGGQMGRILAVRTPDVVRKVVAIGAPLRTKYPPYFLVKVPAETLDRIWRAGVFGPVHPEREQEVDDQRYLPVPNSVELVSIYSRTDGIVDWRYCFDDEATMIEVSASHLGLINSIVGITAIGRQLSDQLLPNQRPPTAQR